MSYELTFHQLENRDKSILLHSDEVKALFDWEEVEFWSIHDEGDWEDEGKYSHCESIIFNKLTGKYYRVNRSRSGSYFSDYHYDDLDHVSYADEVEQKEVMVTKWVSVS